MSKTSPCRSHYYHDKIDMDVLLAGDSYENLPDTYVIFICDGVKTVYLNAHVKNREDSIDKIKQNRGMEEHYMLLEEMMRNERQEGKLERNTEGKQEFLLTALESKFSILSELREKIMSETDIEKLELWFQVSLKVSFLEEFKQNMCRKMSG
mgnify:CR=1 FL=1